jgi:hypothetical protein
MFKDPHRPEGNAPASAFERKSVASKFRPLGDPPASAASPAAVNTVSPPAAASGAPATPTAASATSANDDTIQSINSLYEASLINIRQGADKNSVEYLNRVEANREFFVKALYVANKAESDAKYNTMKELNDDMGKLYSSALGKAYANSDPDNTIKFDYTIARDIVPLLIEKAQSEIEEFNIFEGLTAVYGDDAPSHVQVLKHLYKNLTVDMFKELYPSSLSMNYSFFYPGVPNALATPNAAQAEVTATASSSSSEPAPTPVALTSPVSPVQPTAVTLPAPGSETASASAAPASEAASDSAVPVSEAAAAASAPAANAAAATPANAAAATPSASAAAAPASEAASAAAAPASAVSAAAAPAPIRVPNSGSSTPKPESGSSIPMPKTGPKEKPDPAEVDGWKAKESKSGKGWYWEKQVTDGTTKINFSTFINPSSINNKDEDGKDLPLGWLSSKSTEVVGKFPVGATYYFNNLGSKQWYSPNLGVLPEGWRVEMSATKGKKYYTSPLRKTQFDFPVKVSSGLKEVKGWTIKESRSSPGKFYYYNPVTKESKWTEPKPAEGNVAGSPSGSVAGTPASSTMSSPVATPASSPPSSPKAALAGWEELKNGEGKSYYARKRENGSWNETSTTYEKPLPAGWEEVMNSEGQPYYVKKDEKGEYIANSSTREKPTDSAANASVQAGSPPKEGMHWNANSGKWVDDVAPTEAKISPINKARQEAQKGGSRKKRKLTPRRRTMKN